jgi:hypothetical protein
MLAEVRQAAQKPIVSLKAIELTAIDKLEELMEWNRNARKPTQNGITHQLQDRTHITIGSNISTLQSSAKTSRTTKQELGFWSHV